MTATFSEYFGVDKKAAHSKNIASAPFQAIRSLQQVVHDEAANFPLAAEVVKSDFYVASQEQIQ